MTLPPLRAEPLTEFGTTRPWTAPTEIEILVPGQPVPQGSKRVVPTGAGHRVIAGNESRLLPWRAAVTARAAEVMDGAEALSGPVRIDVLFLFARPLGHFGKGRNADALRPSAPYFRDAKPDLDKLLRAVFDGLSGVVFRDDAQVADVRASKRYGSPSARILVQSIRGDGP